MTSKSPKYWIIAASKDHVKAGIKDGIAQACHGKSAPLKRLRKGDFIIYYSGKQVLGNPDKCQAFTALGKVLDDEPYHHQVSVDFCPSRRKIEFIKNKKSWGYPFRFGFFEINHQDFELISSQMLHHEYA
ncbi:MAG: EVE domain-containing protein [Pedobacter sp.]|nr:MAG: EVE domain-containing protein [Pedobacter sp.]